MMCETPATIPAIDGEWIITLNGYALRKEDLRRPVVDLPIDGKVTADGQLGEHDASVQVVFSEDGVEAAYVSVLREDMGWSFIDHELSPADDQPERGERWTTRRHDPEATVEVLPPETFTAKE